MDTDQGTTADRLINELRRHSHSFEFFQAVRLLEQNAGKLGVTGDCGPLDQEPIRFRPNLSLVFPKADLEALEIFTQDEREVWRMTVNFMGLYGTTTPLPTSLSESILQSQEQRERESEGGDSNRRAFLDVFHHRLIALLYRSFTKYRYYTQFRIGATDPFSNRIYALMGLHHPTLRKATEIDVHRLLPFAGILSMRVRSASTLCRVVSHYFGGIAVSIEEHVERWVHIDRSQHMILGKKNCTLSENAVIGEEVLDRSTMFRLWLGPLSFEQYRQHTPDGECHAPLRALVRLLVGDQLEYEVALKLKAREIPLSVLSESNEARLG